MASTSFNKLECNICYNLFNTPKILPCFHTFCQSCLEQLVALFPHGPTQILRCPTCRRDNPVPRSGVAGFQENFYITDELEARRARDDEKCVLHSDQQVTEVCKVCDVHICDECKAKQHGGHPTVLFNNEIAAARMELEDLLKEKEGHSIAVKTALIKMRSHERATEKKIKKFRKDIKTTSSAWQKKIDELHAESLKRLDTFASAGKAKLQNAALQAQKDLQVTAVLVEQTRSVLNDGRGISVLAYRRKVRSDITDQNRKKDIMTNLMLAQSFDEESLQMNRLVDDVNGKINDLSAVGFWKPREISNPDSGVTNNASQDDYINVASYSNLPSCDIRAISAGVSQDHLTTNNMNDSSDDS